MQGQQRTNIFLLCALFFPEVLDNKCSIVLFFLTTDYYDAILLLTLDTHKLIISGGFSVWNTSPTSARTAAISCSTMQWDDVVKKAASAKKKVAWHVDMVNILWIKRKNHLHFVMQMVKSVEVAGFEPAAFWSRSALKFRHLPFRRKSKISKHFSRLKAIAYNHLQAFATRFPPSARAFYQNFCTVSILFL